MYLHISILIRRVRSSLAEPAVLGHNSNVVKILAVSDEALERLYSLASTGHFKDVDLILGCGDLPYTYLENLVTLMNIPMCYVPGNHDPEYDPQRSATHAEGGSNLDLRLIRIKKFLIGGLGGSIRYRPDGANQYTQSEAYWRAYRILPGLLFNRLQYGRALDILITHSPPFHVHDDDTQAHQGLKAINWLIRVAKPRYHLHGHTHFYRRNLSASETSIGETVIINVHPYKVLDVYH